MSHKPTASVVALGEFKMVGFFRKVLEDSGKPLSAREETKQAVAYFVVLMIYADGSVEDEEVRVAMGTLSRCALFGDNTNDEDFRLLQKMEREMNQDSAGRSQHYACVLAEDNWKYTAAAIMVDIMLADGHIDASEIGLIKQLGSQVEIYETEFEAIVATVKALRRAW